MNVGRCTICCLAALVMALAGVTSGAVIYVDDDAPGGDGSSWAAAFRYLQDALAVADTNDEIRVAQGMYVPGQNSVYPDGTGDRTATFQLINGVTIKGGYAGLDAADPDARNVALYETILSGDLNGDDGPDFANNGENSRHVVYTAEGINETAVLDGCTITAGNAGGSGYGYEYGGGMCNLGEGNLERGPRITGCTFSNNSARRRGGGMYNLGGLGYLEDGPIITGCTFSNNYSGERGGGMYNKQSNPIITGCTFSNNYAATDGGGMYNQHESPILSNCIISDNFAAENGGGIVGYALENDLIMTNCIIVANEAGEYGGGILSQSGGGLHLTNSIFWDNSAYEGPQAALGGGATFNYCCVQGGEIDIRSGVSTWLVWGSGNIIFDPCFADASAGDYHLKSRAGRWEPNGRSWLTWVKDAKTSPCIDAGDPNSDWTAELWPHGKRVNMGAFGGTPQASMSESSVGNRADLDNDGSVNFGDFTGLVDRWRAEGPLRAEDLNRDAIVNFFDILQFVEEWLWREI